MAAASMSEHVLYVVHHADRLYRLPQGPPIECLFSLASDGLCHFQVDPAIERWNRMVRSFDAYSRQEVCSDHRTA